MPLLNRWEEHQELIEAGRGAPAETFYAYRPGKWNKVIANVTPTSKKAGFEQIFTEETTIKKGGRLIILPKREEVA